MEDLPLNAWGIFYGTDKSQLGFDYLRHYSSSLARFRRVPINLLEIGVDNGASLRTWKKFFPLAKIIGIDIQERCRAYAEARIFIEIGSQTDRNFLDALINRDPPTICIDDGSHITSDIIFTFENVFPKILPGGCYIIEDLFFHEGPDAPRHKGSAEMGAQDYILSFARRLLDGHPHASHKTELVHRISQNIDRIEIVGRAGLIWKRDVSTEVDFGWLQLIVEHSKIPKNYYLLARFVLRTNGPLEIGERMAREAVACDPRSWSYLSTLADVLERQGQRDEAIDCLLRASKEASTPWLEGVLAKLAKLQATANATKAQSGN